MLKLVNTVLHFKASSDLASFILFFKLFILCMCMNVCMCEAHHIDDWYPKKSEELNQHYLQQ